MHNGDVRFLIFRDCISIIASNGIILAVKLSGMNHTESPIERTVRTFFAAIVASALLVCAAKSPAQSATRVGLAADRFTIDGKPTFLLGVSYFDALDWHLSDLDALHSHRFNLIRIFLDWNTHDGNGAESAFDQDGNFVRSETVRALAQAAAARGIVVDVTILHAYSDAHLKTPGARENAVRNTVRILAEEPNVFFDLINEHEENSYGPPDWSVSHQVVQAVIQAARQSNPNAILFVSSAANHLFFNDQNLQINSPNVDGELSAGVQVLAPHFDRNDLWYDQTGERVTALKSYLGSIGRSSVPVYLQEENRRGFVNYPSASQFVQAAKESRDAGAAAWIFHTAAGFDLGGRSFVEALDSEEQNAVNQLADAVFGPAVDSTPPAVPNGLRIS